jgi:hyperosmotically inducible protein
MKRREAQGEVAKRRNMKSFKFVSIGMFVFALALTLACSEKATKAPDVTADIRHGLDQAGLKDVSVSQDEAKGVVTLNGNVGSDDDKNHAESIAKSFAGTQVVSDQIGVRPTGEESTAKKVDSDLDSGINKNLEAMLIEHRLSKDVKYRVTNGVVTLKGDVTTQGKRDSVEKLAQQVPNVKQVVNELEVKHQKATTTN